MDAHLYMRVSGTDAAAGDSQIRINYHLLYPDELTRLLARRGLQVPPGDPYSHAWKQRAIRLLQEWRPPH